MLAADYVFWLALALLIAANLYCGPRITSARLPMQWGLDGKPTWHAPKAVALWGIVALALAVRMLIWVAMSYMPDNVHSPEIGLLLFSIIVVVTHFWMLRAAMRSNEPR
jgi:hypothetical protein